MSRPRPARRGLWTRHDREFRDPAEVAAQWEGAGRVNPALLKARVTGRWWETLSRLGVTLLVTREYEHLVMALGAGREGPRASFMRLPHPSGIAADRKTGAVWIASTRMPNLVYRFEPAAGALVRLDARGQAPRWRPLVPVSSKFHPGSLYLHDLALVGGKLCGTATGMNAVVWLDAPGPAKLLWWPRSVERRGRPDTRRNYLQLNSIAAGASPRKSFYSASAGEPGSLFPGDPAFPVDQRGVIFSGATREPMAWGLTRPHSARLFRGRVWVDNSGYGELGFVEGGRFRAVTRFPGWLRGLSFCRGIAFVGTSRVIPRFRSYAPGLEAARSSCGVHAVDASTGRPMGSIVWPAGNQVFGLDWLPARRTGGLPFTAGPGRTRDEKALRALFYSFATEGK